MCPISAVSSYLGSLYGHHCPAPPWPPLATLVTLTLLAWLPGLLVPWPSCLFGLAQPSVYPVPPGSAPSSPGSAPSSPGSAPSSPQAVPHPAPGQCPIQPPGSAPSSPPAVPHPAHAVPGFNSQTIRPVPRLLEVMRTLAAHYTPPPPGAYSWLPFQLREL